MAQKIMSHGFLHKHKVLLALIVLFLVLRLLNLTLLPIFNDEAIYLDWGWRETHVPGLLFYSLYDAKQPLLMWFFGIFQMMFSDQLFAGRFASVLTGVLSMWGIWKISTVYFSKKVAVSASLLYILVPVFSFYDRQALMESAITAVGIWALYFFLRMIDTERKIYAVFLGMVLGLGIFIKTSSGLFVITIMVLLVFLWYRKKTSRQRFLILGGYTLTSLCVIDVLLFLQPGFWSTLSSNSRYSYALTDFLSPPTYQALFAKTGDYVLNLILFLTPLVLIFGIYGMYLLLRKKEVTRVFIVVSVLSTLILQFLLARSPSIRYVVSYLPLFSLFAAFSLRVLEQRNKILGSTALVLTLGMCVLTTGVQLLHPYDYIRFFAPTEQEYISGQTSGYGVPEVAAYLSDKGENQRILVGTAMNTGNPESALIVAFHKAATVQAAYVDAAALGGDLSRIDCVKFDIPAYYVARNEETGDMTRFLRKEKVFPKPSGKEVITVYSFIRDCSGKGLPVSVPQKI